MLFTKTRDITFQLRLLHPDDAFSLFEIIDANRLYLREWLPWIDTTHTVEDSHQFIEDSIAQYKRGESVVVAIWCDKRLVGCIALNTINHTHQKAELGYWLSRKYQRKGIITRACRQMLTYAFNELHLNRVEILVAAKNTRSRAIPERLGFTQEGTLCDYYKHPQGFLDMVMYSMLHRNWNVLNE